MGIRNQFGELHEVASVEGLACQEAAQIRCAGLSVAAEKQLKMNGTADPMQFRTAGAIGVGQNGAGVTGCSMGLEAAFFSGSAMLGLK